MLDVYEHAFDGIREMVETQLEGLVKPLGVVQHNDVHITVPKPGARAKTVWVFDQEEDMLANAPAGLLHVLAGKIIARLQNSPYMLFARGNRGPGTVAIHPGRLQRIRMIPAPDGVTGRLFNQPVARPDLMLAVTMEFPRSAAPLAVYGGSSF